MKIALLTYSTKPRGSVSGCRARCSHVVRTVHHVEYYASPYLRQCQDNLPGIVPDADLTGLYRCTAVFCFPSVKGGWGLVVLEAIATGLPVITAKQPPFTEFLSPYRIFDTRSSAADTVRIRCRFDPGDARRRPA